MLTRARVLIGILAGISLLAPASLAAQRPQTREGFWISFGVGGGGLAWDCDGCAKQDQGGPTAFLRLGGTTSKQVLLGAEINTWSLDIGNADITAGYTAFTVYWYPSVTGGMFVKGGLGAALYTRYSPGATDESFSGGLLLGTGYDIRVGRRISITPMLTLWTSSAADLERQVTNTTIETGFHHSGATLQLGITFH